MSLATLWTGMYWAWIVLEIALAGERVRGAEREGSRTRERRFFFGL